MPDLQSYVLCSAISDFFSIRREGHWPLSMQAEQLRSEDSVPGLGTVLGCVWMTEGMPVESLMPASLLGMTKPLNPSLWLYFCGFTNPSLPVLSCLPLCSSFIAGLSVMAGRKVCGL